MQITTEMQGDIRVVRIHGRLDGTTMQAAESAFLPLLEQGDRRFVLDLADLEYISSAGLRFMLTAAKKTKAAGGKIALCGLRHNVYEVFEISGFLRIFAVFATREEATAHVAAP
jgi:anti-sigma B factor antagonist